MSDIQVGDKFRVTASMYGRSVFGEGEHEAIRLGKFGGDNIVIMAIDDKEYGFFASEVEKVKPVHKFAVGDNVQVTYDDYGDVRTEVGTVLAVDENDDSLPYRIETSESGSWGDWFAANEVRAIEERKDHTELTDEADDYINVFEGTKVGDIIKRLRDALVEESYREGK